MKQAAALAHTIPDVMSGVQQDLAAIECSLGQLRARYSKNIAGAALQTLLSGGKRLRSLMTCAVLRSLGRDPAPLMDLIAVVELVHAASLLHDDVVDQSEKRRAKPAAHVEYGAHTAILAGDFLLTWGLERVARSANRELQVLLAATIQDLCEGEVLERERARDTSVDFPHVRLVNRLKTAALYAYAAETGAILADAPLDVRAKARAYGLAVGEGFQAIDDLLDWDGNSEELGKPIGQDLARGYITVPVAMGFEREPQLREIVSEMFRSERDPSIQMIPEIAKRLKYVGAFEAVRTLADDDARRSIQYIRELPDKTWRERLIEIAHASVRRNF